MKSLTFNFVRRFSVAHAVQLSGSSKYNAAEIPDLKEQILRPFFRVKEMDKSESEEIIKEL